MRSIMKCRFGSHLYGTNTPESDTDYKEVFVPSPKDILLGEYVDVHCLGSGDSSSKNTKDDVDNDMYSLRKFISLLCEGDTMAMDMLHANKENIISMDYPEVWNYIYSNRSKFYTCSMTSYLGYLRKQSAKYGVKGSRLAALRSVKEVLDVTDNEKYDPNWQGATELSVRKIRVKVGEIRDALPLNEFCEFVEQDDKDKGGVQTFYNVLGRKFQMTISVEEMKKSIYKLWEEYGERARAAEANEGIDWKSLSHALRAGLQIKEIYQTGDLVFPLKDAKTILQIKKGELSFKEVQKMLEDVVSDVEILAEQMLKNGMPKEVDCEFWNDFIVAVHKEVVDQN